MEVSFIQQTEQSVSPIERRSDIESSFGPFFTSQTRITYPQVAVRALYDLFREYNHTFDSLVAKNREWQTDYQLCDPWNLAVQIDMAGLPSAYLERLAELPLGEVREQLRHLIFEIESSISGYQWLERFFPRAGNHDSAFRRGWRDTLDGVRRRSGRPIAILAVTQEKYESVLQTEFGCAAEPPKPEEVYGKSGFDAFWGPDQFRDHLDRNDGDLKYALYVRSSDPISRLRDPRVNVNHPLLGSSAIRKIVRAATLTANIDDPSASWSRRINDSKLYLPPMRMAYLLTEWNDIEKPEFAAYLAQRGIDVGDVLSGSLSLRAKPAIGSYGGYGHLIGKVTKGSFRYKVRKFMRHWGAYLIQPEVPPSIAIDPVTGTAYAYIDRIHMGIGSDGDMAWMGGFRTYVPVADEVATIGRIAGQKETVWAEIEALNIAANI